MTELLIVSRPRGRIFKWIQGYKEYQDPIAAKGFSIYPLEGNEWLGTAHKYEGFRFVAPITCKLKKIKISMRKEGSPSGTAYIQLWSDDSGSPGSKIGDDLASFDSANLTTDYQYYEFDVDADLQASTAYWIVIYFPNATSDNFIQVHKFDNYTSDRYRAYSDDGSTWTTNNYTADMYLHGHENSMNLDNDELIAAFDFIYPSAGETRLEVTFTTSTNLSDMELNGTSIGTTLAKEDSIPQADNYTLRFKTTSTEYAIDCSIQRWLYFSKTSLTLDDLDVTEAYLQEIEFGADGGTLRIDDDPANEMVGSAGEKIQFTDILVPFRKLEWISGGGEVLILGVE